GDKQGLTIYDRDRDRELAFRFGQDYGITAMSFLALVLWPLGDVDRARRMADEAVSLRLSQEVYFAPSIAAAGIAAHETGHALQDAVDYLPLEARTYIVPLVQLASQTAPWLFIAGMILQLPTLAWVGIILFGSSSVF